MDIHAQAWALREQGLRLADIAKELHIELRDVAQLLSDKTQPKHIPQPAPPKPAGDAQADAALRRLLEAKQAQIDALTATLAEAEERASVQAAKIRDLKAVTTSGDTLRLKAIAEILACRPAKIELALDTLTATLADESALREHLQATVARLESRIDARDDDNIKLMARLGDLALLLGCGGPDIEQTVADLMSSLAEEIERRDAALESVRLLSEVLASERATLAHERQARLAQADAERAAQRPDRKPRVPAGWSDWMPPSDLARALGCHPTNVTQAVYSHRSRVRGRAIQARRELTLEERARYGAKRYLVRYELMQEEMEG